MNRREKKRRSLLPGGIGANVVEGELNTAIQVWKQELKNSENLNRLYENREYVKPSVTKRKMFQMAKYKNKFREE